MIDYGFGIVLGPMTDLPTDKLREWRNSAQIYKWCRQYEPLETYVHDGWLRRLGERSDVKMYGVFKENGPHNPVGVCGLTGLDLINRHAEFSLYVAPGEQGEGYGEKALKTLCAHGFMALGLNHIFGETFDGNPASAMFEKVGFKKDGTRRGFYYRQGRFIDAHIYSLLAPEFRELWKL